MSCWIYGSFCHHTITFFFYFRMKSYITVLGRHVIQDDYQLSLFLRLKRQTVSRHELIIQIFKKSVKLFLSTKILQIHKFSKQPFFSSSVFFMWRIERHKACIHLGDIQGPEWGASRPVTATDLPSGQVCSRSLPLRWSLATPVSTLISVGTPDAVLCVQLPRTPSPWPSTNKVILWSDSHEPTCCGHGTHFTDWRVCTTRVWWYSLRVIGSV